MTNKTIPALTAASVPLVGTETLPVFQGGTTVKITRDQLFTPAATKGINFTANTPAAGMTSQLLNWYEEGTWTPNQGDCTVVGAFSSSGKYVRIGRQITVWLRLSGATSIACTTGARFTTNLPYSAGTDSPGVYINTALGVTGVLDASGTTMYAVGALAATAGIYINMTYQM